MDLTTRHRFHLAPGFDPSLPDTWIWEDRSADVDHVGGGVSIQGGRGDEVSEIDAGSATLRVDNTGGHYCTRNPLGRWYGKLARNTPARWGVIAGAEAFTTNTSNGWGTPDIGTTWTLSGSAANWSSSGGVGLTALPAADARALAVLNGANARDGEATAVFSVPVVATGGPFRSNVVCRWVDGSNWLMFTCEFTTAGNLSARICRVSGGVVFALATAGPPLSFTYTANQRIKMRCQWDGPALRMRIWPEASGEPTTWTVTSTDTQILGSGVGLYLWRDVANTNAGSVTVSSDALEVEAVEIVGTVPEWPIRWDSTAAVSYAPIQIAGITRRISQGRQPLRSPIYRQLIAQPAAAYWPLEDGSDATTGSAATPGTPNADVSDVTFGGSDCPAGSAGSVTLNTFASSHIVGQAPTWPVPLDGYAGMLYFRLPALPPGNRLLLELRTVGTVTRWSIAAGPTTFNIQGYDSDGTLIVNTLSSIYVVDPTKWTALQLETQESGGTVSWALLWNQVGSTTFWVTSGSYSGTADKIVRAQVIAPMDGTLVCHLWLGDDLLQFVDTTFMKVSAGYAGELAADRVARLCREEKVLCAVEPGNSEPLGVQRIGTLPDLLKAAEQADQGVLYEQGAGYGYRPRYARYNRTVGAALAIGANGDISDPAPEPTDDDLRVRNQWTMSRDGGGEATSSDPAHISLNGLYADSATANVQSDDRLYPHAGWRVHLGTWGEMRWPQVTINLTDRPDLLTWWLGRRFGERITISGIPAQGPIGANADLTVEGWSQDITSASWLLTLNCSPAKPWDVGVYGTSRYDSASTTLASGINAAVTSVPITTVNIADVWSTTSLPYTWAIDGEVMTVTAMTAAAGTGPFTQTATVTRSVNAISKSHLAAAPVHLSPASIYAL